VPVKSTYPVAVRAIAFIMLFAMLHYVAGYRLLYSLGVIYTKNEAKECMTEKNNIKKLVLSVSDYSSLKWTEENKEFSFHNEMYDVVNIQKTGNTYIITTYADDPETEVAAALHHVENELFHPDQSNKTSKSAEDILSSFQKDCTPPSGFNMHLVATAGNSNFIIHARQKYLPEIFKSIWHPPASC
jgi:hypothetical protein